MLVRESFGVQPRSALGYSFGEAIMAAALGVWRTPTQLTDRLERSPTFRSRLQGPMCAVREHWGVPEGAPLDWRSYCIRATAAEAYTAVAPESRAYLCMINAPDQVVIAGEQQAATRVLATLGSAAVPLGIAVTMHCPPARSEYDELVRIHDLETTSSPAPALFSSSEYAPAPPDRASLAHAIAGGYTKALDFPRLVRRVYAEGARVFLELGGRRNCSTWIEKILRGRPHAAIPCDSEGLPGDAAILRAIARLFAHRVPLNLAVLDDCD
jgi:PfaB family protein